MVKSTQILEKHKVSFNKARIKKAGENFEVVIDVEAAVRYKEGQPVEVSEILKGEHIFADVNKGERASEERMTAVFGTSDPLKVAKIILDEGEIQITSEIREAEREKKKKRIISIIASEAIDPKTKLPHPPERIRLAIEEANVTIDMFKPAEQQLEHVLERLKSILPLSFQKVILAIRVPAQYAGKAQTFVRKSGVVMDDKWASDGAWEVTVKLSPGAVDEISRLLNDLTKGSVKIEEK
jgi:ribosome maturation protein SDO1